MNLQERRQNSAACHSEAIMAERWRLLAKRRETARVAWCDARNAASKLGDDYAHATDELLAHETAMPKALLWAMWKSAT